MHPLFKELFIQTDAEDLPAEDGAAACADPGKPGRPWSSGPPPVTGSTSRGRDRRPACRAAANLSTSRDPILP